MTLTDRALKAAKHLAECSSQLSQEEAAQFMDWKERLEAGRLRDTEIRDMEDLARSYGM